MVLPHLNEPEALAMRGLCHFHMGKKPTYSDTEWHEMFVVVHPNQEDQMVHQKEEVLICPSVKYADQIAQCKQVHCKDCDERAKKQDEKMEKLENKLKVMTIVGAVAVTVVGKDMIDKIMASFSKVQEVQKQIDDAASNLAPSAKETAQPSNGQARTAPFLKPWNWQQNVETIAAKVDGDRSAYVTSLSTPYAMDPSMASKASYGNMDTKILFMTPLQVATTVNSSSLLATNTALRNVENGLSQFAVDLAPTYAMETQNVFRSVGESDMNLNDNGSGFFYGYAVPAPSAISLLALGMFQRRRSRI
jgi:hypothetical protein